MLKKLTSRSSAPPSAATSPPTSDGRPNVLRDLLLQRAVQTQLYYNVEFKNDFEKAWLLRFAAAKGSRR